MPCIYTRLEHLLEHERSNRGIKVGNLDRGRLFEQGLLFGIGGNEASSPLVRVFPDQIASDGTRLVEDEALIVLAMAMQS